MEQLSGVQGRDLMRELRSTLLLFHSFDPYILLNASLKILAVSSNLIPLFFHRNHKTRLEGSPLKKLRCPNLEKLVRSFNRSGEVQLDSTVLHTWKGRDKRLIDVRLSKVEVGSESGLTLCSLRDVTDRIRQEERLWQTNEELTILYEMSQVEVRSLQHEDILQNVLARFSELTNLGKGFFVRNPLHALAGPEQINYNLVDREAKVLGELISNRRLPRRFFRDESTRYQTGGERLLFFRSMADLGFTEVLSIPVFLKHAVFGVLAFLISSPRFVRISTNNRFFNLIGQQVGLALEKAMLFSELESSFKEIARKNRQFREELALAQKMQRGILSLDFPRKPGIHFAVKYVPSYHLSGDFYDIFEISKDRVGVLIADVCGHGINAALITSFLKASVQDMGQNHDQPNQLLDSLNHKLHALLNNYMFVSAFYLIVDLQERKLYFSNAGHPYPLRIHRGSKSVDELKADGTLLSVMDDSEYSAQSCSIESGDRILLYTDGMFDMKNKHGEFISMDYVRSFSLRHAALGGHDFIELLISRMFQFANHKRFEDDINLIVIDFD